MQILNEKYAFIVKLHNSLKKVYFKNIQRKPLVAQTTVKEILEQLYLEPLYEKLYCEYYIFYSLFSQNTNDSYTKKTLQRVFNDQKKVNFKHSLDFYWDYFYKHKDRNTKAMLRIMEVIKQILKGSSTVEALHGVRGLGFKSSALLYNEFISKNEYPVIDVHVIKAYNFFSNILKQFKPISAQSLYKFLKKMSLEQDLEISYDFCSMLYYHRKFECTCKSIPESCSKCKKITEYFQKEDY